MSIYRRIVWFCKGMSSYTRTGYENASKNFCASDLDVDCAGKIYLVTGANSGIGKCVTKAIVKRGGTVHMVCRNKEAALSTKDELEKLYNNKNIHVHIVDLSQPKSVSEFARNFVNNHPALDVLVNNAGCMVPRFVDDDGFEGNFVTNSLSPYILMKTLKPLLEKSENPRVINVSSGGMLNQKLDYEDPQCHKMEPFDPVYAYAQHKRQQVIMTEIAAEDSSKIFYSVMHPGWADTPAVRSAMPEFYEKMKDRLRTDEQGADTVVWLALSPAALKYPSGLFYQDRVPIATHLPLAWTKTTSADNRKFIALLDQYFTQCNKC